MAAIFWREAHAFLAQVVVVNSLFVGRNPCQPARRLGEQQLSVLALILLHFDELTLVALAVHVAGEGQARHAAYQNLGSVCLKHHLGLLLDGQIRLNRV